MRGPRSGESGVLVVFDYSGTLSRGAVRFAEPVRLSRELHRSGLVECGVSEPTVLWERIVNPTWDIGSTTTRGYVALIAEGVAELTRERGGSCDGEACRAAAGRFVRSYLHASSIYEAWVPVLTALAKHENIDLVIATDHYAEATQAIRTHLRRAGVERYGAPSSAPSRRITIANSAELGALKECEVFWSEVLHRISSRTFDRIVLIDDFGRNEYGEDSYATPDRVHRRRDATAEALSRAASVIPTIAPFWPKSPDREAWNAEVRRVDTTLNDAVLNGAL